MDIIEITSTNNKKIKEVVTLIEKSKERRLCSLFIVEGVREITSCIKGGYKIKSLFYNNSIHTLDSIKELIPSISNINNPNNNICLYSLDARVYSKIAYREDTEGIVAQVEAKTFTLNDIKFNKRWDNPLILILESIEKPGNIGALLRTADACGIDAVLICEPQTDLYNPNLIRASLGGIFTNQVVCCSNSDALKWLRDNNIEIFTAQLQDSHFHTEESRKRRKAV